VKQSYLVATLVAIGSMLMAGSGAVAQQPRGPMPSVAILDLTWIFKHHARFQQMTSDMRRDVEAAENTLKNERDAFQKMQARLEDFKRGTPEFKALEEDLAKKAADLNLQVNIQKKNFLEQEARMYFTVYQEVLECVKYYADSNGISLVMRFNGDPVDRSDPQEVLKELNKSVIYYNRAIDITPIILDKLNASRPNVPLPAQQVPSVPQLPPRR
jgi:Skp family chaperone for outer membrane proteins